MYKTNSGYNAGDVELSHCTAIFLLGFDSLRTQMINLSNTGKFVNLGGGGGRG